MESSYLQPASGGGRTGPNLKFLTKSSQIGINLII